MTAQALHFNPFAHLVSPMDVLDALRQSEALASLRSEIYRPLDRPFLASINRLVDIDAEIDAMPDEEFDDEVVDFTDAVESTYKPELWG